MAKKMINLGIPPDCNTLSILKNGKGLTKQEYEELKPTSCIAGILSFAVDVNDDATYSTRIACYKPPL